jgi:hypothetical protein
MLKLGKPQASAEGAVTHEIGAMQRERTNLAERLRQLQTAGEDTPWGSSSIFTGSSF